MELEAPIHFVAALDALFSCHNTSFLAIELQFLL